jgi:hypothetical protein
VSALAQAEARSALQSLDHFLDLWPAGQPGHRGESRAHVVDCVADGLADTPADLGEVLSQLAVLAISHASMLSPARIWREG